MSLLSRLLGGRHRTQPVLDVGLQAERTAMAWQRTALGVGGFSALLLHLAGAQVLLAVPGAVGLAIALGVVAGAERRYLGTIRLIDAGRSPAQPAMLRAVAVATVWLAVSALALLAVLGT